MESAPLLAHRLTRRGISWLVVAVLLVTPLQSVTGESIASYVMLATRGVALLALLAALLTEKIDAIDAGRAFLMIGVCDMVASAFVWDSTPDGIVVESIAYGTILPIFALLIAPSGSRRSWSLAVTTVVAVTAIARLIPGRENLLVQIMSVLVVHTAAVFALDAHAIRAEAAGAMATIDPLTGLVNRRPAIEELTAATVALAEDGCESSVIMVDLDRFKQVNDTLGHEAGDDALRRVSVALTDRVGKSDLVGRWGGEEFLVVLPGSNIDSAIAIAERMRAAVEGLGLTASFGVAQACDSDTVARWVARADAAMYLAKRNGRNRVVGDGWIDHDVRPDIA